MVSGVLYPAPFVVVGHEWKNLIHLLDLRHYPLYPYPALYLLYLLDFSVSFFSSQLSCSLKSWSRILMPILLIWCSGDGHCKWTVC